MFGIWGTVIGILLLLFGVFSIFFLPSSVTHQEEVLAVGGIIMGIIALIFGFALIFF